MSSKMKYEPIEQVYKGILLTLIPRKDYEDKLAKRYRLNNTYQNVWIPNKHTDEKGYIKPGENIDYVFRRSRNQVRLSESIDSGVAEEWRIRKNIRYGNVREEKQNEQTRINKKGE